MRVRTPDRDPGAARTRGRQIRNLLLYPTELRDRFAENVAKLRKNATTAKRNLPDFFGKVFFAREFLFSRKCGVSLSPEYRSRSLVWSGF